MAGELVSMKISADERKKLYEPSMVSDSADGPNYPYGLGLQLEDSVLDKLKMETLPKVGTTLTLIARVDVTRVSSDQGADKKKRQSVSLQITDLCLEPEAAAAKVEDALYGKE